jgi:hypothetical protein
MEMVEENESVAAAVRRGWEEACKGATAEYTGSFILSHKKLSWKRKCLLYREFQL